MNKLLLLPALAAGALLPLPVRAALPEIREFKLDNGLTVVLAPSKRVPTLTYYTFFKVGSRNERPGITGVSHFMEHMMFLGAKKYGPREFDRVMEQAGGSNNAFTSNDMTAYNDEIPAAFLPTLIDMEADRLADIALDPKLFESEKAVVMEENRLRDQDSPEGLAWVALSAGAFKASPYRWPVGGWMGDLTAITRDQGYEYIKSWYVPNNAIVIISGDFDPAQAERLMREKFSPIPARPLPPQPVTFEPPQFGPVRIEIRKDVSAPILVRGHKIPGYDHPDTPVLEVLSEVLAGGDNGVLVKALVREEAIATGVYADAGGMLDANLFGFQLELKPGVTPETGRAKFDAALAAFLKNGVTPEALRAAKSRLALRALGRLQTNNGLAGALGRAAVLSGDWRNALDPAKRIDAVTGEQVLAVAKKYLHDTEMTEVTVVPTPAAPEPEAPAPAAAK